MLTKHFAQAFSSDVWRVTFNPENGGQLTTSGAGHIRFWKMASTFTGLKLQGQIGALKLKNEGRTRNKEQETKKKKKQEESRASVKLI